MPYKEALKRMVKNGAKLFITNDTVTGVKKILIGQRNGDGRFWDSITGVNGGLIAVINNTELKKPDNGVAHEFKHAIHRNIVEYNDSIKLEELYNKAKKENKCLDSYASWNSNEYFAQGYEAYTSIYKPHANLIDSDNYKFIEFHTRSVLKRKDPELYDFIKYCTKKYGQPETLPH
jgi:hypothetical protein